MRGFTVVELMFVVVVMAIACAAAIPSVLSGLDRTRAIAAARRLAQQCGVARFHAVGRGRSVALRFTPAGDDYLAQMFIDGNHNGVLAADVADGIDTPLGAGVLLSSDFPGARVGLDPSLGLGSDPIRLSGSNLLSYSPAGTATAGTVYVLGRDSTQLAVRVLGVTGRARILRYERTTGSWEPP